VDDEDELDEEDEVDVDEPPVDVEVELPPVDVEVEEPPVEVELPPVEVEVDPPEEVLEITMPPVELPPKKPPEKKPPPKPKPPDEPPTTTMPLEPPLEATATGGGGGGANIGGMMVRVTVWVGASQPTRRTVRRTSRRPWLDRRVVVDRRQLLRELCEAEACRSTTVCERAGALSATWTALPPMIAPPQVQAQSFARAILTDITASLFQTVRF